MDINKKLNNNIKLSDQELIEIMGGYEAASNSYTMPVLKYGIIPDDNITPVLKYGILPDDSITQALKYGIVPDNRIRPLYGVIPNTDSEV